MVRLSVKVTYLNFAVHCTPFQRNSANEHKITHLKLLWITLDNEFEKHNGYILI